MSRNCRLEVNCERNPDGECEDVMCPQNVANEEGPGFTQFVQDLGITVERMSAVITSEVPDNRSERTVGDTAKLAAYGYTVYGTREKCYFCSNPGTHIHRVPSHWEWKTGVRSEDMRAYFVCAKCAARGFRMSHASHEELVEYIGRLEARGSVRGRVAVVPTVVEVNGNTVVVVGPDRVYEVVSVVADTETGGYVVTVR